VTLTLEEKQKIAKQQEQQRYMKAAKPLEAKSSTSATQNKPKTPINQPVDLTASLMKSNMMGLSTSAANKPASVVNGTSGVSMNTNTAMGSGIMGNRTTSSSMGSMNTAGFGALPMSSMNQGSLGSSSASSFSQNSFGGHSASMKQSAPPIDLSSFDNLMTSSSPKPKVGMNQMNSVPNSGMVGNMNTQSIMGNMNTQGFMGNPGMMVNRGNMGQGMMGNQSMMGNQGMMGPGYGGQGQTMFNSGFVGQNLNSGFSGGMNYQQAGQGNMPLSQPMGAPNLMQPLPAGNQTKNNVPSAKNDLDDLFG
jgi:SCY1-like protein 2